LLYGTTFFIFLNFYISQTVTPIYILKVGGTEFYSGLQSTLFCLTAVILRFYFGPLADQKGNKLTLYIGAAAFATAPLLFLFSSQVGYIIAVRIFQSVGLAAFFSSSSSLASSLSPKEKLGRYIGYYRMVTMSTLMVGPSLALKVINSYGYTQYHLLGLIIGIIALVLLYFVKEPARPEGHRESSVLPRYNMLQLLKEKQLSPIYLSIFVISVSYGLLITFSGIFIERTANGVNPGIFFTLFGLGSLISSLTAGRLSDRIGRAAVAFTCILIMGSGVAVFYYLPAGSLVIYCGSLISGIGYAGSIAVLISWIVDIVNPLRRTTALTLQDNAIDIGISFGSFVFGVLIPYSGMPWAYGLSGGLLMIFGFLMIISGWLKTPSLKNN